MTAMVEGWGHLKFWKYRWPSLDKHLSICQNLSQGRTILPDQKHWFRALELTKPKDVKVVILGPEPYSTKGLSHGLALSVQPHNTRLPRSLRNVLDEYQSDLGLPRPISGDLTPWAQRGVLLLNTILTVEEGKPLSHSGLGWEKLTYEIVRTLAGEPVVFILVGKKAQEFTGAIDPAQVISTAHPTPFNNTENGFRGTKPFSRANEILKAMGRTPVDWRLPS